MYFYMYTDIISHCYSSFMNSCSRRCVLLNCLVSSRRQGDIGMEGPRGGVGGRGETVRKHDVSAVETSKSVMKNIYSMTISSLRMELILSAVLIFYIKGRDLRLGDGAAAESGRGCNRFI